MNTPPSRKEADWPRKVRVGRESVTVYKRTRADGVVAYMVANYSGGSRKLDSHPTEEQAMDAAQQLARRLSQREVLAASLTNAQASEYASAIQTLGPIPLLPAISTLAECLKVVPSLAQVADACRFYAARHKRVAPKRVEAVVQELLAVKAGRGASARYQEDLRARLLRFAADFKVDVGDVATADIQGWLDKLGVAPQTYQNFRRVLHLLFAHAVARGHAIDNPVEGVETLKTRGKELGIFTPGEMARLLDAASPGFLPSLAIGAFAGLRSAEIERLRWEDVDMEGRHIVVGVARAKTAGRRIVPMAENLAALLAPYARREGNLWPGTHEGFYEAQGAAAAGTGGEGRKPVKWKPNGLRHSYASYRFAQTGDAGRVAGELGNSAAVVHKHYRELVKPGEAERWFSLGLASPATASREGFGIDASGGVPGI